MIRINVYEGIAHFWNTLTSTVFLLLENITQFASCFFVEIVCSNKFNQMVLLNLMAISYLSDFL